MTAQLTLIEDINSSWKIPEATRQIGRRGIAEAREVLRRIPRHTEGAEQSSGQLDTGHHTTDHRHPAAA